MVRLGALKEPPASAGPPCRPDWVAVDGPAGAGKSTLARGLARALGFRYIDTGATYRAAALAVLRAGLSPDRPEDREALVHVVRTMRIELDTDPLSPGPTGVRLNGEDVSRAVRSLEVGQAASAVARIPEVRAHLSAWQRRTAEAGPCVMDGRDVGTVVLPDACVKLYVTASLEERARRRLAELWPSPAPSGERERELARVVEELRRRDEQDSSRATAPLVRAPDAVVVDTTSRTPEDVLEEALAICRRRMGGEAPRFTG